MSELMAEDVMTRDVHAVQADTTLEEIARLLDRHHIRGVPVVDERRCVIGVVSEADLIDEHKRETRIPRTVLYGLFPPPGDLLLEASRHGMGLRARDVMSRDVVTATEATPVHELADVITRRKVNRIPILRDGRLVGIVCRWDLVRAMARGQARQ